MKFGIVVFPGSNCDEDCHHVAKDLLGCEAEYVWHHDRDLKGADAVILPGGFAYGDYLRAGALARFSPVMESVAAFARKGGAGARHLQRVPGAARGGAPAGRDADQPGAALRLPRRPHESRERRHAVHVALREGQRREDADRAHGGQLHRAARDARRARARRAASSSATATPQGRVTDAANPNGATDGIAGICNREGNVVGLMPHPDRCSESAARQRRGHQDVRVGRRRAGRAMIDRHTRS